MPGDSLKEKTVNGIAWSAIERFSGQGIQFIFNILIARILLPEDYGVVAMLGIFLAVSQAFIDSGFSSALIRKQDRNDTDLDTVFWFNLVISLVFFLILWATAPLIANFYNISLLTKITRILSFTLIINALRAVHETQLSIKLDFKRRAIITLICILSVGIIGLWMAHAGYGVWALVVQAVVGSALRTVLMWIMVQWKPRVNFSKSSLKEMFGFGSKILATGLVDTVYGNIYSLLIGKLFTPASLGLYNRAESFATFPSSNLYGVIQNVSYPVLCTMQADVKRLYEAFRKFLKMMCFISVPAMFGLAAIADPFIRVVLTDKWAEAIPLLQILCISISLYPINAFNNNFPNVVGRSDCYFKLSIINKCVDLPLLIISIPLGLKAICWSRVIASLINLIVNTWYTKRFIGYSLLNQIKDLLHIVLSSAFMAITVWGSCQFFHNCITKLTFGIVLGISFYFVICRLFHFEEYNDLLTLLKKNRV